MRVLLDECLPRKLKLELTGHDAKTVPETGWAGLKNGELLRAAAGQFDAFITVDRNLPAQRPLMARVRAALEQIRPGNLVRIEL
jgi:hypothetical protein